jgi:hypothetical protein
MTSFCALAFVYIHFQSQNSQSQLSYSYIRIKGAVMSDLKTLFRPRSIAVIGASIHSDRAGHIVMRNLLDGEFDGPIMPVHPTYNSVCGILAYRDIPSLPITPDFAILCTPARENSKISSLLFYR